MPLYEYICEDCGRESELLVAAAASPACPECGSPKMSKLLSIVSTPARGGLGGERAEMQAKSCGSHCGCHPHG